MKKILSTFFIACVCVINVNAQMAKDSSTVTKDLDPLNNKSWGVGLNLIGTYGYGIKVSKYFNNKFSLSTDFNTFSIKNYDVSNILTSSSSQKVVSKIDVNLGKASLSADYYLTPNFSIFAGAAFNLFKTDLKINYTDTVLISKLSSSSEIDPDNDVYYSPEDVGEIQVELKPIAVSPFLGIGFGKAVPAKRVGVKFDLGIAYNGSPTISNITATGQLTSIAEEDNKQKIENAFASYKYYPFMNFAINFKIK